MARPVDWDALRRVFQPRAQRVPEPDTVVYNRERMPRWLARDLMQERAAIREYDAGMGRDEAEASTLKALD